MNHIISVENLSVYYNNYCVLKDVDFKAKRGEFIAVVGRSGGGKTTFLHALAGLISFSGNVYVPKNLGMVFQHSAVFPWLTVSENIAFGLKKKTKDEEVQIIKEQLRLTHLEQKKDQYPTELSGGQIQRIAIARVLAQNSNVLLMDEPYSALDAYTRDKMQQWLLDIWMKYKKTVVFVTHNIEEAVFLADRVLVLGCQKFVSEYEVPFERPRNEKIKFSLRFNQLRQKVFEDLNNLKNEKESL
jgi:NitT/TauT family transport system ATP-binding protein